MATEPSAESFYDILSIARSASAEEVRKAYKQKVLETHPDKLPQTATEEEKELAQEQFHRVHEAFEVLNDPFKRRAYDIHVRPLPNYVAKKWEKNFEEEHMRRMKDRKEWAKKNEQRQQARMKASKQVTEDQNIQQCKTTTEMTLLDKMLQELYTLNPEWEVRKKKAQAWKASRVEGRV